MTSVEVRARAIRAIQINGRDTKMPIHWPRHACAVGAFASFVVNVCGYASIHIPYAIYVALLAGIVPIIVGGSIDSEGESSPEFKTVIGILLFAALVIFAILSTLWLILVWTPNESIGSHVRRLTSVFPVFKVDADRYRMLYQQWLSSGTLVIYLGILSRLTGTSRSKGAIVRGVGKQDRPLHRIILGLFRLHPFAAAFLICLAVFEASQVLEANKIEILESLGVVAIFGMISAVLFGGIALIVGATRMK